MAILTTDIVYRLSGGAANADPALSIGGAKSSVASGSTIFDDVSLTNTCVTKKIQVRELVIRC